jgi:translation initiation factor IF-2
VKGHTTDFEQKVSSIQIEKDKVEKAKKGDHIGIKVSERVRPNDKVFLV